VRPQQKTMIFSSRDRVHDRGSAKVKGRLDQKSFLSGHTHTDDSATLYWLLSLHIEVVAKIWHSTLKDYFIVFIAKTVTCSMSRSICCLSVFIVKLIYLFIMFRFFLLPDILFWWNKDMDIDFYSSLQGLWRYSDQCVGSRAELDRQMAGIFRVWGFGNRPTR